MHFDCVHCMTSDVVTVMCSLDPLWLGPNDITFRLRALLSPQSVEGVGDIIHARV